ncbi:MAG TPA: 6-phosphogluconolactonase [Gemmatimonadaceae bacterium]|nr:6-phosphogluconolactonase [Gemmatimonadaceae bacterium]
MPAPVRVFDSPADIGELVAERILRGIARAAQHGRSYLLGLPTGRTPRPVYAAMARQLHVQPQSLGHVTLVMMDEYLRPDGAGGFRYALDPGAPSCHAFTETEITGALDASLDRSLQLRKSQVWFPDPVDAAHYDTRIAQAGGIDFFLLASGASDGHVAFNPPGSARDSRSRIVELSEETRRDNLLTFPALGALANVPTHGVTVGIATITDAREAVMLAWGKGKRTTVARMLAATSYDPAWPATLIHDCSNAELLVDAAAAMQG